MNYIQEALQILNIKKDVKSNLTEAVEEKNIPEFPNAIYDEQADSFLTKKDGKVVTKFAGFKVTSGTTPNKLEGIEINGDIATVPASYKGTTKIKRDGQPTDVIGIKENAFKNMNLKEIHLEDSSVEAFGYHCFSGNDNVKIYAKRRRYSCFPQDVDFIQSHMEYVD